LDGRGRVHWGRVGERWLELGKMKVSLANKHFTREVAEWARMLSDAQQQRLLNVMIAGLCNSDASIGVYATSPEDYSDFGFFLEPLIRDYHAIDGSARQSHNWQTPLGKFVLTEIDPNFEAVSMRARVARTVRRWKLPPSMSKTDRVKFETMMERVFAGFGIEGQYYSLTPGHKSFISNEEANNLRAQHYLFNDMSTDRHLTSAGVASDWPYGRGMWLSGDRTKMIWVGEEDHLRIISIIDGVDLGEVDASLHQLLSKIEKSGIEFVEHPVYGVITTCPSNMGTGKRLSVLAKFPHISEGVTNEKRLKEEAERLGLQARGVAG
jgi:creatine kinase